MPIPGPIPITLYESNLGKDACIAGTCLALPKLNIKGLAQYDPSQIASDISWVYGDSFQLSLGVIYRFWSKIPQIIERVNPGSPHPDPTKFKDTLSPSLGTEYRIFKEKTLSIFLRSGVFYSPSPVPQGGHLARRVDNHRTTFSLGSGTVIKDGDTEFFLDNFFQFHYLVPREFPQKEIDTIHSDGNFWMGGFSLGIRQ